MARSRLSRGLAAGVFAALAWHGWAQQRSDQEWSPRLLLEVVDAQTGERTAARITVEVDGRPHEPRWVGAHGLRYVSVHVSKKQTFAVIYARGSGEVEIPLPPLGDRVRVTAAKGFDYLPAVAEAELAGDPQRLEIRLERWHELREDGWRSAETHLHYDRPEPAADRDWFHMLAGDDLSLAQFMVLEGGMVPGVWARQYGYGQTGVHSDGRATIVPGEEYRDRLQGHLLLFGLHEVIEPIMAGTPRDPHNWPAFADVLDKARSLGGLVGPAHGGTLSQSPTAVADALLGKVDFWEIGNTHLWALDDWYRLMNVGVFPPPIGGTDLPNNPYREPWQPFLGEMRTYVRSSEAHTQPGWRAAVRRGDVFVTSGPAVLLSVNGESPGATVRLPAGGGEVSVEAQLASPRKLEALELVVNGKVRARLQHARAAGRANQIVLREKLRFNRGGWIAARGWGGPIDGIGKQEVAHTGAVRVLAGEQPIRDEATAAELRKRLGEQKAFYSEHGAYPDEASRARMLRRFDEARESLSLGDASARAR